MRDFKKLQVWQKSHLLTLEIYKTTSLFPKDELYGLVSQMRRSSSSIPTNIAEGCGRESNIDFNRFLTIAKGSASELEYQLLLAKDLNYIDSVVFLSLNKKINEIRKMIYGYGAKLL
ncbi:four helix bundle protein [Arcicella rigui]|uniref:Four helix bundle protein n=1 Tax=Arcicella rigui TaxID=797020 RepID=A0ABU5Q812_9BACT|nr:four helix bundle protein [Arcicella rigui]MEA5138733.1 four helix bundle protein [Arcicella rigui]